MKRFLEAPDEQDIPESSIAQPSGSKQPCLSATERMKLYKKNLKFNFQMEGEMEMD